MVLVRRSDWVWSFGIGFVLGNRMLVFVGYSLIRLVCSLGRVVCMLGVERFIFVLVIG